MQTPESAMQILGFLCVFLCTQQALIKFEEHHIDLIDIISSVGNEILNDDIKLVAPGQGITCTADKVSGFFQIQFQGNGKGHSSWLGWLVLGIVSDLGEELPVHIGPFIDVGVLFSGLVDELQECF